MTISLVQSNGQASGASSFVFTKQALTVGSTAFVVLGEFDAVGEAITAVKLGTTSVPFTVLVFPQTAGGGSPQGCAVVMVPNIQVSGQTTVALTYSGGNIIGAWGGEVAGLGPNPVLNTSIANSGDVASMTTGTTPATTVANAFILAAVASYNGSSSAPSQTWANTDLGINSHLSIGWEIQTAIGQTYAWTQAGGGTLGWAGGIIAVTPSPTLVQSAVGQGNDDTSQAAAISTTAGNAYVVTFAAWQVTDTPFTVSSVSDTAGNTWNYATQAGVYDSAANAYAISGIAWCLPSMQGTGNTTKAVTAIQVDWSIEVTDWGECVALEFAGVPTNATVLGAASTNTIASNVTSYTTPSITATTTPSFNPVLAVANTSSFGEFTAVSSGWTAIVGSDTIGAYNLAASSGSVSVTATQAANDIPTSNIIAIGVGAAVTALTASATLNLSPTFAATRIHGHSRSATRGETPTFTAGRTRGRTRSGTRAVIPTFLGTRIHGHTRSATRAETPTFSAGRTAGRVSHALLSVVPSFIANRIHLHNRNATRPVVPSISATGVRGHDRSATRSESPSISATAVRGHTRSATLTVSPTFFAGRTGGQAGVIMASARLTVTPTFHASGLRGHTRSAVLNVTPSFVSGRIHGHARGAARTESPTIAAGASRGQTRRATLAVAPSLSASRIRGRLRSAVASIIPTFAASGHVTQGTQTFVLSVGVECDVYFAMTLTATMECNVGAPYQGNIASLATDRWYSMYPS